MIEYETRVSSLNEKNYFVVGILMITLAFVIKRENSIFPTQFERHKV